MKKFFSWKLLIVIVGVIWAYTSSWLTDDIFVTFRYIDNLFSGNGLVYNVGERVEGFTHPLWLAILTPFYPNLEFGAQLLGLLSFAGVIFLLTRSGWLAATLVVCNFDMRVWATGGLETMFFTFLILLSVWATLEKKDWVGWVLLALVLTRPDGLLVAGVILLFNWRYYKPLLLLIPFLALRYLYYGDLLPNTYYAKSGERFYFSQGLYYVWIYASVYVSTFLVFIGFRFIKRKDIALPMAIIFSYLTLFVIRVGGDFMYARFIIPIVPLIYFVIEYSLQGFKNVFITIAAVLLLVIGEYGLRTDLFYDKNDNHRPAFELQGVTDEQWYWSHNLGSNFNLIDMDRISGTSLKNLFGDTRYTILLRSQCALAYYLGTKQTCIMSEGLTDRYIARLPLEGEGRVGHERRAPIEYIRKRGCQFLFNRQPLRNYYPDKPDIGGLFANFPVGNDLQIHGEILKYDSSVASLFKGTRK